MNGKAHSGYKTRKDTETRPQNNIQKTYTVKTAPSDYTFTQNYDNELKFYYKLSLDGIDAERYTLLKVLHTLEKLCDRKTIRLRSGASVPIFQVDWMGYYVEGGIIEVTLNYTCINNIRYRIVLDETFEYNDDVYAALKYMRERLIEYVL